MEVRGRILTVDNGTSCRGTAELSDGPYHRVATSYDIRKDIAIQSYKYYEPIKTAFEIIRQYLVTYRQNTTITSSIRCTIILFYKVFKQPTRILEKNSNIHIEEHAIFLHIYRFHYPAK